MFPKRKKCKVIQLKYYKHLNETAQQIKSGLVSGRLACNQEKPEMLNNIAIYISILNFEVYLEYIFTPKNLKGERNNP